MNKHKNLMLNTVTVIVTIVAGLTVAMRWHGRDNSSSRLTVDNWEEYGRQGQRIGPAEAAVTIVEFADFLCVYCRRTAADIKVIRERYPNEVAVVFRHYPLSGNALSVTAARAAECAAIAGRFEVFHDLLFIQADSIGEKPWSRYAEDVGISAPSEFEQCITDPLSIMAVRRDVALGDSLGVRIMPTLLINDLLLEGSPSADDLERHVRLAIQRVHAQQ